MIEFQPKCITFDCYGTLTAFGMSAVTRELVADRVPAERMEGIQHRDSDGKAIYESVPSWGPHPDVPGPTRSTSTAAASPARPTTATTRSPTSAASPHSPVSETWLGRAQHMPTA